MNEFQIHIKSILDMYKCKSEGDYLVCLPIYNEDGDIEAYLRPITQDYRTTIKDCAELLSKWRVENPTISTGTFEVTEERTKRWLDKLVVGNDDRIIFMIQGLNGHYLGHIGLTSFDATRKEAEIDSVLRGTKNEISGLMKHAMAAIIRWGQDELQLNHIKLKVFNDNTHAVEFYKKCGFIEEKRLPLVKVSLEDEEKWEISADLNLQNAEKYYLEMVLVG
ncbi:GNAT family N-acetyltransferase [Lachnospiraceae bacterium ZAX-1]